MTRKWIAPRSGGYRPGGDFPTKKDRPAVPVRPPQGGAGISRLRAHPAIPVPPTVPERTAARFTGPTITPEETP